MQNVAAAGQLIARDRGIGKEDRDHPQHPCRLVVAGLQQVGNRELRKLAGTRRNEVDQQQPSPSAARLPQRREAVLVGILRSAQQRPRADPRRKQRKHQHKRRQRPPRHQVVGLGLHPAQLHQRHGKQREYDCNEYGGVQVHSHSFIRSRTLWLNVRVYRKAVERRSGTAANPTRPPAVTTTPA